MTFFSKEKLLGLAHDVVSKSMRIKGVSPVMVASIAMVESSGDPKAYRYEPHLGEASAGLTQVLFSTAKWLAVDLGFSEYGIPKTEKDLEQPELAIYICASYLTWLRTYKGERRSDEFVVRGYNGGPNGITLMATARYWEKYKAVLEQMQQVQRKTECPEQGIETSSVHVVYEIKKGDTLFSIARKMKPKCKVDEILAVNPGIDPGALSIGQKINLPDPKSAKKSKKRGCIIS